MPRAKRLPRKDPAHRLRRARGAADGGRAERSHGRHGRSGSGGGECRHASHTAGLTKGFALVNLRFVFVLMKSAKRLSLYALQAKSEQLDEGNTLISYPGFSLNVCMNVQTSVKHVAIVFHCNVL